jgi:hypothetical protein
MKLEIRNVQYFAAGSHETACFVATVYVEGKQAGTAENRGEGGPTMVSPLSLQQKIDAYGATLPLLKLDMGSETDMEIKQDAETLIGALLNTFLRSRDLRRLMAKRVLYTHLDKPGIYQTKPLTTADKEKILDPANAALREKWRVKKFLNTLPPNEALDVYSSDGR